MKSLGKTLGKTVLASSIVFLASCNKDDNTTETPTGSEPTPKDVTVKGVLEGEAKFSSMNEAVEESNTSSLFTDANSSITLFAADNEAWSRIFTEFNVSSMTELKNKMGEEAFTDFVLYLAVEGNTQISGFTNGYYDSEADNASGNGKLSIHITNESNSSLVFNGGDENGATTTGSNFSATNGAVIGINAVIQAQSNFENIEEDSEDNSYYLDLMASADASIAAMLQDESEDNTVIVGNQEEIETVLDINLSAILDVEDLENLLDDSQKNTLLSNFGVSLIADLLVNLHIDDLLDLGIDFSAILDEMDEDDNTELLSSIMFDGSLTADYLMSNDGNQITAKSGVSYTIDSSANDGTVTLVSEFGGSIVIDTNKSAQGNNGAVYQTQGVQSAQ